MVSYRTITCGNFTTFTTFVQLEAKLNSLDLSVKGQGHETNE